MLTRSISLILCLLVVCSVSGDNSIRRRALLKRGASGGGGGVSGTAWVTDNPATTPVNYFTGCIGTDIAVGGSAITLSGLGLYVLSGNDDTVTVSIKTSDGMTTIATTDFDTSGMSPGWNYIAVSGTLSASTTYRLSRTAVNGTGDLWNDEWTPTVTGVATAATSSYASDCVAFSTSAVGKSFSGVNFKYTAP